LKEVHILAKLGRPKGENPREYKLSIRFSEVEREKLEKYAAKHNTTITGAIRKGVLDLLESGL
jgi:hypothetical protein